MDAKTDIWKFTPMSDRISALWGRYPKSMKTIFFVRLVRWYFNWIALIPLIYCSNCYCTCTCSYCKLDRLKVSLSNFLCSHFFCLNVPVFKLWTFKESNTKNNKAGYTAILVACGWAGAVLGKITRSYGQELYAPKAQKHRKGTNQSTKPKDQHS